MHDPKELRRRAEQYRVLATQIADQQTIEALIELAEKYETLAEEIEARAQGPGGQSS